MRSYDIGRRRTIADINNAPDYPLAGAITAALLSIGHHQTESWAHFDIPAWIDRPSGAAQGAEATRLRAMSP